MRREQRREMVWFMCDIMGIHEPPNRLVQRMMRAGSPERALERLKEYLR